MFVEMSLTISEGSVVYPGVSKSAYEANSRMSKGDPNNTTYVRHFLHSGTHVDAPYHFDNEGKQIHEIPIEDFVYERPLILDVPKGRGELVTDSDLAGHEHALRKADLVLFHTGYAVHLDDEAAFQDEFPAIDESAARLLRDDYTNIVAIGIDTLSIETVHGPENGFSVHRQLVHHEVSSNRPLLIYETVNIEPVISHDVVRIFALPIRFAELEAAPVAMVAEVK